MSHVRSKEEKSIWAAMESKVYLISVQSIECEK